MPEEQTEDPYKQIDGRYKHYREDKVLENKRDLKNTVISTVMIIIGLLGILVFVYPITVASHINIGTILGCGLFAAIFGYGLFRRWVHSICEKLWSCKAGKAFLIAAMSVVTVVLALVVVITSNMVYAANARPEGRSTMVVLGCAVRNGGPSLMLRERLVAAEEYLKKNPEMPCIVSGGQGPDESISEAQCMYEYLVKHGIDKSRIYMEDKSTSTRENIRFSKEMIDTYGLPCDITIVTNEFHEYRAMKIADRQKIKAYSVPGNTAWWLLPTYYFREMAGVLYEWITG